MIMALIVIPTKSQWKPELKQQKDSNEKPIDHFDQVLFPYHYISFNTSATSSFSIYK